MVTAVSVLWSDKCVPESSSYLRVINNDGIDEMKQIIYDSRAEIGCSGRVTISCSACHVLLYCMCIVGINFEKNYGTLQILAIQLSILQ